MAAVASYVEQSDALLGVLSVRETIRFAARLRYVARTRSPWAVHASCRVLTYRWRLHERSSWPDAARSAFPWSSERPVMTH